MSITAIILTKNEEKNIKKCIDSIKGFVDRIVVVDSYSDDETVNIAKELGADIFFNEWKHYADQFNWALDNIDITTTWVYRIDADEVVTPELAMEISEKCKEHKNDNVNGFIMKFKIYFLGRFLKYGGAYPIYNLTIFKYGKGRYENRAMGEHVVLTEGSMIELKNDCLHYDVKDISTWIDKHNKYSTREVTDYTENLVTQNNLATLYGEAEKTKKIRDNFYYKLPLFLRARFYYWYRYYLKMGFLDGKSGKIYAFLQAYWYRYLVDVKIYEKDIENNL